MYDHLSLKQQQLAQLNNLPAYSNITQKDVKQLIKKSESSY